MEQTLDPTAGLPPSDTVGAAGDGGSFFGIPYGWPLILAAIALIALMWMARTPMRRVLWQTFFVSARLFGRWGLWLKEHGQKAQLAVSEKIISHRADELNERMLVLEDRIGRRAEALPKETGPIIQKLDSSTHQLATAANALADINLEDAAERAFRAALPSMETGRGLNKLEKSIAQSTGRAMNERLTPLRPALTALKTEGPRLRELSVKFGTIEKRFNEGVTAVNKAFADYEECLRGEDRNAIAGKQSLIIPWLIALIVTVIAISGVFLNFFLIERPMAEIVGESANIAGIGLPAFAAMIVIFLEFVAGVVLMDAAGFTKIIPTFHTMTDRSKKIMLVLAIIVLSLFSALEVALALVRENIIENEQAIQALASAGFASTDAAALTAPAADAAGAAPDAAAAPAEPSALQSSKFAGISLITWAQVILAAIIPWLLATAALPLETIVRNSVFLIQKAGAFLLIGLAFLSKTLSTLLKSLGVFFLAVYDLIIFAPLWVERRVKRMRGGNDDIDESTPKRDKEDRAERNPRGDVMQNNNQQKPGKGERERERELQRA